jgi:hypothetical protein
LDTDHDLFNTSLRESFVPARWKQSNIIPILNPDQAKRMQTSLSHLMVLQKSIRIIRDGYVNKYTNPRRIETTTAAYHVEIQAKLRKTRPKTKHLIPSTKTTTSVIQTPSSTQCSLCVFKAKNTKGLKIHNSKMDK